MVPCERSCHKEYRCAYESPITSGLNVMAKVKFLNFKVKQNGTMTKVLSQGAI